MDAKPEEKLCLNCKRWIAASNHLMHTVHCQRNIVLCESCDEPVPKSQLEDHKQVHVKTSCEGCRKPLEKGDIEEHKMYDCPKRLTKCKFCELECAADCMKEHVEYCGSRTEECAKCGQFILLKEKAVHEQLACSPPMDVTQGDIGLTEVPLNAEPFWREEYGSGDGPPTPAEFQEGRLESLEDVMLPCEFCGEALPMEDLILHQSGCQPHGENGSHDAEASRSTPPPVQEARRAIVTVPCDGCGELVPEGNISNHERACERVRWRFSGQPEDAVPTESRTTAPSTSPIVTTRRVTLGRAESTESDVAMLPCEFCEQLYPEQNIVQHQAMCDSNPDQALPSDQLYPPRSELYEIDSLQRQLARRTASPPGLEVDLGLGPTFGPIFRGADPLSVVEAEMERMTNHFVEAGEFPLSCRTRVTSRETAPRSSARARCTARRTQNNGSLGQERSDDVAGNGQRAAPK